MPTCMIGAALCLAIVNAFLLVHASAMVIENTNARPKTEGGAAYNDFSDFDELDAGDSIAAGTTVQAAALGTTSAAFSKTTTESRTTYATSTMASQADTTSARSSTSPTNPSSLLTSVTTTIQAVTTPLKATPKPSTDLEPDLPGDFKDPPAESSPASTSSTTTTQVSPSTATSTTRPITSAPVAMTKASPKPSTLPVDPDDPFRDSDNLPLPTLPPTSSQTAATTKRHQSASGRAAGRAGVIPITARPTGVCPHGEAAMTAPARPTPASSASTTLEPGRERIPLDEGRSRDRLAAAAAGLDTEPEMFTWLMLLLLLIFSTVAWIWFCCVK